MEHIKLSKEEYNKVFAKSYEGKTIRVFTSYSSTDKVTAAMAKEILEKYGLSVFLAGEDIRPTVDWQKEVIQNLKACDIFLPMLTAKFGESEWTDQETGMALAMGKFIIPLSLDENPYGFIRRLQACKFDDENIKDSCLKIIHVIKDRPSFKESLRDCLLRSLEKAHNFDAASEIINELKVFETFTREQVNQIIRISIINNQVRMCNEGQEFLKLFTEKYDSRIDPILRDIFEKIRDSFYGPRIES